MKVIVITVDEAGNMEMTTNAPHHKKRMEILKAAILKDLKPVPFFNKFKHKPNNS